MRTLGRFFGAATLLAAAALSSGCASMMQPTTRIDAPQKNVALVTFVRPSVFFGDGMNIDLWDGEHFIGVMQSGTLVQYAATPGEHLFLASAENWSYTKANLQAGKQYFIKANVFPGVWTGRVALGAVPKDDERIAEWQAKLKPMTVIPDKQAAHAAKEQGKAKEAVAKFKAGEVKDFAELKREDGR